MPADGQLQNRVKAYRQQRGWSQEELARRADISRASVSAIEMQRLVPSVAAALALATTFGCRVEDLFGSACADAESDQWAWLPTQEPCRFWQARVGGKTLRYPAETTAAGVIAHDGVFQDGAAKRTSAVRPEQTLVMASCDPAASLLANEYARASGFRLIDAAACFPAVRPSICSAAAWSMLPAFIWRRKKIPRAMWRPSRRSWARATLCCGWRPGKRALP